MKKALSLLLCLVMCLSLFPVGAIAEEAEILTVPESEPEYFGEQAEMMPNQETVIPGEVFETEPMQEDEVISFDEPADVIPEPEQENYEAIVEILTIPEQEGFEEPEVLEVIAAEATEAVSECGDDLIWTLDDEGTLTVAGTGEMFNFAGADEAPWYSYSSLIKSAVIESGVTSIGEYSFTFCDSMMKIEIADSVVSIGEGAFSECRALREVIYSGTEADWGNIVIESDNEPLVGSKFIFISEEGIPEEAISEEAIPEEAEELSAAAAPATDAPVVTLSNNEDGTVKLTWEAVEGAVSYQVQYYSATAGKYTVLDTIEATEITDTAAPVGEARTYRVRAKNADGIYSSQSSTVYGKRKLIAPVIEEIFNNEDGYVVLKWTPVGGVAYEIWCYSGLTNTTFAIDTVENVGEYTDTQAEVGEARNYYLRATASGYNPLRSGKVYGKRILRVPELSLAVNDDGTPTLSWPSVAGAVEYEVWYYTSSLGAYTLLETLDGTEYTHEEAPINVGCNYKVRAVAENEKTSSFSASQYNWRKLKTPVLSITENDEGIPVLSWPSVGGAAEYEVFIYTSAVPSFTPLETVEATEYAYAAAPFNEGCSYKVRAISADGKTSSYSVSVYYNRKLKAPVLSITENDDGSPVLSWTSVAGAEEYEVWVYTSALGRYTRQEVLKGTEYTDELAPVNEGRSYKVRAVTKDGKTSAYSNYLYNKRTMEVPVVSIEKQEDGAYRLYWTAAPGIDHYEVWYSSKLTNNVYTYLATVTDGEFTHSEAPLDVSINYKVKAVDGSGKSTKFSDSVYARRTAVAPVLTLTVEDGNARLSWTKAFGSESYEIWLYSSLNPQYVLLTETTDTEYLDTAGAAKETRYFKIRGVDADGNPFNKYSNVCNYKRTASSFLLTQQPADLEVKAGETAEFSVAATGQNLTYLWQEKAPSGEWTDTECTDAAFSFMAALRLDGYQYRCVVSSGANSITSDPAALTVAASSVVGGVTYEKTENGMKVVSFASSASSVVIPQTVEGIDVTEIGERAFENCTTLESIDLPDTVEVIGYRAFAGCENLSSMN